MKPIHWLGSSYKDLCDFPDDAKQSAGYQLHLLQCGEEPTDWRPMATIGQGVNEIRIREATGAFRVFYVAKFEEAIYVLHSFQKKTQRTPKQDLDLASDRYKTLLQEREE